MNGFRGEIVILTKDSAGQHEPDEKEINLTEIALNGLNHLRNNPRPGLDYECRFAMDLMKYPVCPGEDRHDPISIADTDIRMDWEYGYMKEMTSSTTADKTAEGVRKRIIGYLRGDGGAWASVGCMSALDGVFSLPWATGKILYTLSEDCIRTPDESKLDLCGKIFRALKARADWVDGRAFYAGGNGFYDEDGWAVSDATPYHPGMVLEPVLKYYEASKDPEALDFAIAFSEGEMANDQWNFGLLHDTSKFTDRQRDQALKTSSVAVWPVAPPDVDLGVAEDGSFLHHSHLRGHLGWGMAHLASITMNKRLTDWSLRLLDFYISRGTDYGWIPESMSHPFRSETCAVSDVISMAVCMAKGGHTRYWDVAERYVRNYIRNAQFFRTPQYDALYMARHPGPEGESGLKDAMVLEGGFQGGMGINDRLQDSSHMDMMGCCVPEGMRAVHTVWTNTIGFSEGCVSVNMNFSVDSPYAVTKTMLPERGGVSIEMRCDAGLRIRMPPWVKPGTERAIINSRKLEKCSWVDSYLEAGRVQSGDIIEITYDLPVFSQKHAVKDVAGKPDRQLTIVWRGNTVKSVSPKGEHLPIY